MAHHHHHHHQAHKRHRVTNIEKTTVKTAWEPLGLKLATVTRGLRTCTRFMTYVLDVKSGLHKDTCKPACIAEIIAMIYSGKLGAMSIIVSPLL